jgi:hypothetical protein
MRLTDLLFIVGSACFAIASVPGVASTIGTSAAGLTYFIGSLFFTSAGFLQLHLASNPTPDPSERRMAALSWPRRDPSWWGAAVQLFGTLCFNVSTFNALNTSWSSELDNEKVWRPDMFGSIAFLVASWLIVIAVRGTTGSPSWRGRDRAWWVATINVAGSVFFMASALAAFVLPESDELLDASVDNTGTLLGAICFLTAALIEYRGDPR